MGFIREPKGVDFFVVDKPFTAAEKKEFSKLIQAAKKKQKGTVKRKMNTRARASHSSRHKNKKAKETA